MKVVEGFEMGLVDGEDMPVEKCQCGARFGHWDQVIELGEPWTCPQCLKTFQASYGVTVYEV